MLTVNEDGAEVERRLAAGGLACPGCGGGLAGWGFARPRLVREEAGRCLVRPRRARCAGCAATHVLLPVGMLLRRADAVEVVGEALSAKAGGLGAQPIAARLGRPLETVRGWLRRFTANAELLRQWFIALLVAVAPDPHIPDPAGSPLADAVTAVKAAGLAIAARFGVCMVTPWRIASAACQGGLLSPVPPTKWINTSSPWQAAV